MNSVCRKSNRERPALPSGSAIQGRVSSILKKLLILIPVGILLNVVYCLVMTDRQMLASIVQFHPGYLLLAGLLCVVPWFTGSLRLFTWNRFLGQPLTYRDAFEIAIMADLGAAIAPPMIGGGAVKIGMLMSRGLDTGTAISLPVLENLEDALFFLLMVPVALTVSAPADLPRLAGLIRLPQAAWWIGAVFASLCLVLLVLALGLKRAWVGTIREKILAAFRTFQQTFRLIGRGGKKVLVLTLLLTAIQWTCRYSIISLLLISLGIPVQPVLFMVLQVLVFALTILVPSPGGAGGAEIFFSLLYMPFLPAGTLGLVTTGWRFFTFYLHTLLAAVLSLFFGVLLRRSYGTDQAPPGTETPVPPCQVLLKEDLSFVRE